MSKTYELRAIGNGNPVIIASNSILDVLLYKTVIPAVPYKNGEPMAAPDFVKEGLAA